MSIAYLFIGCALGSAGDADVTDVYAPVAGEPAFDDAAFAPEPPPLPPPAGEPPAPLAPEPKVDIVDISTGSVAGHFRIEHTGAKSKRYQKQTNIKQIIKRKHTKHGSQTHRRAERDFGTCV